MAKLNYENQRRRSKRFTGLSQLERTWLYRSEWRKGIKKGCKSASNVIVRDGTGKVINIIGTVSKPKAEKRRYDMRKRPTFVEERFFKIVSKYVQRDFSLKPVFQKIIYGHNFFYIIDIYIPKAKLAIEIDGRHHQDNEGQRKHDIIRDKYLRSIGIDIIRFQNQEVRANPKDTLNRCYSAIKVSLDAKVSITKATGKL